VFLCFCVFEFFKFTEQDILNQHKNVTEEDAAKIFDKLTRGEAWANSLRRSIKATVGGYLIEKKQIKSLAKRQETKRLRKLMGIK
jgi:hypothetical protein